jgi:dienelactone hydrolase
VPRPTLPTAEQAISVDPPTLKPEPMKIVTLLLSLYLLTCSAAAADAPVEIKAVVYKNLVARLYLPKVPGKVPVVIAFGGSDGGLDGGNGNADLLAPHGIAVLSLAYFKGDGLPATLDQIPLEYFISALDYVASVPDLDAARIGVVSGSRGSEAALLLAALDARIKSVVVTTPSSVAWQGMTREKSAWTYQGRDVPALAMGPDLKTGKVARFEAALANGDDVRRAQFAIEKINGPVFFVSAQRDQIWPSWQMATDMTAYLKHHGFRYSVTHSSYPTGHGFSRETAPEIKRAIVEQFLRTL